MLTTWSWPKARRPQTFNIAGADQAIAHKAVSATALIGAWLVSGAKQVSLTDRGLPWLS